SLDSKKCVSLCRCYRISDLFFLLFVFVFIDVNTLSRIYAYLLYLHLLLLSYISSFSINLCILYKKRRKYIVVRFLHFYLYSISPLSKYFHLLFSCLCLSSSYSLLL